MSALTPFSGSSPAWAARPRTMTSNVPTPLRPVFSAPPSADGSSTSTAPQASARSSISARDVAEPISSSDENSNSTPDASSSEATAWMACTMPAFMSNTPGPVARPPSTLKGRLASVPMGNTVSWWPSTSTRGVPPPDQCTCGPAGPSTSSAGRPSQSPMRPATASADRVIAATSRDGDSTFTSRARSASANSVSSASDDTGVTVPGIVAPTPWSGATVRAAEPRPVRRAR